MRLPSLIWYRTVTIVPTFVSEMLPLFQMYEKRTLLPFIRNTVFGRSAHQRRAQIPSIMSNVKAVVQAICVISVVSWAHRPGPKSRVTGTTLSETDYLESQGNDQNRYDLDSL